jgi:hypothetical protein
LMDERIWAHYAVETTHSAERAAEVIAGRVILRNVHTYSGRDGRIAQAQRRTGGIRHGIERWLP